MCVCVTERTAKGRTNIELREQFILADGVSQSMAAFTSRRSTPNAAQTAANSSHNGGAGSPNMPPYMSGQGPIIKVNHKKQNKNNKNKKKTKRGLTKANKEEEKPFPAYPILFQNSHSYVLLLNLRYEEFRRTCRRFYFVTCLKFTLISLSIYKSLTLISLSNYIRSSI